MLSTDLFNYCKLEPWPFLNNRILVLKNFLLYQKIRNDDRARRNRSNVVAQLEKANENEKRQLPDQRNETRNETKSIV
jgi:hypothetical protein